MAREFEKKFVVSGLKEMEVRKYLYGRNFKQFYLDANNSEVKKMVERHLGEEAASVMEEARVRVINGKKSILTAKSADMNGREHYETEICNRVASHIINNYGVKRIHKNRYYAEEGGHSVEIDFYQDRNLCVMEIEYDPESAGGEDIKFIASKFLFKLNPCAAIVDVTEDENYKNKNLAFDFEGQDEAQ